MWKILPALAALSFAAAASAALPVTGKWLTTERDSIVEIAPCGKALCGRVIKILKPTPDGKPAIDKYNPDPALRMRPVLGLPILTGFTDGGAFWKGRVYDPKTGKSYRSMLTRTANGTLKVEGCILFGCKAFIWTAAR